MKKALTYGLFFISGVLFAQINVPPPQVINSAGGSKKIGSNYYAFNIGETVVGTGPSGSATNYFTQGFLQPDYKIGSAFSASIYFSNETCQGAADGSIVINPYNNKGLVKYTISPSPSLADTTSSIFNLPPGTYSISITDSTGNTLIKNITISASTETCPIKVYHAFSPNNDGLNDTYIIDGLENYPKNHVYFFNRWGQLVWDKAKYNNTTIVWDGKDNAGAVLTSGTYFYVIEIEGKKAQKGWVEITK